MSGATPSPGSSFRRLFRLSAGLACLLLTVWLAALPVAAQEATATIEPPFGLAWGTSTEKLRTLLIAAGGRVVESRVVKGRECWYVEGLKQPSLRRTLFYFVESGLVEVELQYQDDSWNLAKYDAFMSQVKQKIQDRYGSGQVIARSKGPEGDVMQTVLGYQWARDSGILQLYYYSAEEGTSAFRTISLHYKQP